MGLTISNYWFEREIKDLNIDLNYKFNVTAIGRVLSLDFAGVFINVESIENCQM